MSLNDLAAEIHDTAAAHGFWDKERNMGEMLMLATSELAEALEEHRNGKPDVYYQVTITPLTELSWRERNALHRFQGQDSRWARKTLLAAGVMKPEGTAVKLADCIIRILDTMASLGVDIDAIVREKMNYNNTRPHKHGKAY